MSEIDFELDIPEEPKQPSGQSLIPSTDTAGDERELAQARMFEWIGQRKFSAALQKLLTVSDLVELQKLKESKAYKGLKVVIDGKIRDVSTFGQVCDSIGVSERHVSEQLLNLKTFGPEFVEYSDKYLGFRDVRALRKLPDDEREALIEVAKAGDKDQLLDLAESLIVKHASEKEAFKQQMAAKDERLSDMENAESRTVKILKADLEAEKARNELLTKNDHRVYNFDLQTHLVREECLAHQAEAELAFNSLRQLFEDCVNDDNKTERDLRIEQVWVTIHVAAARAADALAFLRGFGLEGMPQSITPQHWMTDDEALRWLDDYERVEHKHIKAKIDRHDQREAAKPKGPGRPRKDK
ncbi:hypothetical protein [Methylomonas rosea]|uniref:DUF3102 domain-containing protein n=1 Tax=Methylomonas rosea TaxID=2952227 RepID=A0ABT1TMY4_9GAMM|nr:hypothetical protein [Methylomonas sp. WSC-7]MCQ8116121.1 hypothetical protein [Methylomonas sp. WSC-7]